MSDTVRYEEALKDAGVNTDRLCVLHAGVDVIIGEVSGVDGFLVGKPIAVSNPRRFMTLRQPTPKGLSINSMIGPMETCEGGTIEIIPHIALKLSEATEETKELIFGLYYDFLVLLVKNKAAQSGLVFPEDGPVKVPGSISSHMR
jgi:hypothetical protein